MGLLNQLNKNLFLARRRDFDTKVSPFIKASSEISKPDLLIDFKRHERGWPLQYYLNRAEPLRARPNVDMVFATCFIKKLIVNLIYEFREANLFKRLIILISLNSYYNYLVETAYYGAVEHIRTVDKLSQAPREFYRVIGKFFGDKLRDIITLILEGDPAYRYRLQDILSEIDIEALKKNTTKEVLRLIDLLMKREASEAMNIDKWKYLKTGAAFILTINKKLREKIKNALLELDLDEIYLSREDLYWCDMYKEYNFGGLTFEQKIKRHEREYGKEQTKFDLGQLIITNGQS